MGMETPVLKVRQPAEFETAFAGRSRATGAQALFVSQSPVFSRSRAASSAMATRTAPARDLRAFANSVEAGGLMAYGTSLAQLLPQVGAAASVKILKGAKPADLPVVQSDQVRVDHQYPDRPRARPHRAGFAARPVADEVIE